MSTDPDPDWIAALGERAGPLADAARRFARRRGWTLGRGPDAIRQLSDAIDEAAYAAEGPEADAMDAALVEEGGALLGCVLLDRDPEPGARHRQRGADHRVLLGRFGCFDPFGAIDAALDAEDPDAELRARLLAAEAEQRGEGPVAQVVGAFVRALTAARPEVAVVGRFDFEVTLDLGVEVDLAQVASAGADPALRQGLVERVLGMLPGAEAPAPLVYAEVAERIVPRLVGARFLEQLGDRAGALFRRALREDLHVTLQLRYPGRARFLRADEVAAWQPADVLGHALERLGAAGPARLVTEDGLVFARTGDGLDAARILTPTFWEALEARLGGPVVLAVPHRDTVVAGGAGDEARVSHVAQDAFARAPHPVSAIVARREDVALPAG